MTGGNSAWLKLVEIQEKQTSQAVLQTSLLQRIVEYHRAAEERTPAAVDEIKLHVTAAVAASQERSDARWQRIYWASVLLIVLSNMLGVSLGKLIELFKH